MSKVLEAIRSLYDFVMDRKMLLVSLVAAFGVGLFLGLSACDAEVEVPEAAPAELSATATPAADITANTQTVEANTVKQDESETSKENTEISE